MRCWTLSLLLLTACSLPADRLKSEATGPKRVDVFLLRDGTWSNLTRFDRPQHLYGFELSPDGRRTFVWHMEAPPRIVSVYDTQSLERIARFSPGRGGTLTWTSENTLLHRWGAGTNVANFAVYTLEGHPLLIGTSGGCTPSPSIRFLATYPTTRACDEPVRIFDLRSCRVVHELRLKNEAVVTEVSWSGEDRFKVRYRTDDDRESLEELPLR